MKRDLRSMDLDDLQLVMAQLGQPKFRAKQLFQWLHQKMIDDSTRMHNLGQELLETLADGYEVKPLVIQQRQKSQDGTEKFLLQLSDGEYIECVLMRYRGDRSKQRNTLCISSQVGCAMGCTFCATGQEGLVRNLSVGEIVGQVYTINHILADEGEELSIGNIVFMGMGEPLLNFENVMKAIRILNDQNGLHIGIRRITVSTCGVVPQIKALADLKLDLVLAISLHAPNNILRSYIMPINQRYGLDALKEACLYYQQCTANRISFEYALIKDFNDQSIHVQQLVRLLNGLDYHLNVIPVKPVANTAQITKPDQLAIREFMDKLKKAGIKASIREEKGKDIDGACGQLRGKRLANKNQQ